MSQPEITELNRIVTMHLDFAAEHAHARFEQYDAERRQLEAAQPSSDFDPPVE